MGIYTLNYEICLFHFFQSVENPAKRYLKYRSYFKDDMFGGSSKCMFIQQTQHDDKTQTAKTVMGYYSSTAKCM